MPEATAPDVNLLKLTFLRDIVQSSRDPQSESFPLMDLAHGQPAGPLLGLGIEAAQAAPLVLREPDHAFGVDAQAPQAGIVGRRGMDELLDVAGLRIEAQQLVAQELRDPDHAVLSLLDA